MKSDPALGLMALQRVVSVFVRLCGELRATGTVVILEVVDLPGPPLLR